MLMPALLPGAESESCSLAFVGSSRTKDKAGGGASRVAKPWPEKLLRTSTKSSLKDDTSGPDESEVRDISSSCQPCRGNGNQFD
jgi:hypothetical protein